MKEQTTLLRLSGLTKTFGNFVANDHIDLELKAGCVRAVLGENGAGKSTLMNMIYGLYRPDAGTIEIKGKKAKISSPKSARRKGIGMVHQKFMLIDEFSTLENCCLLDRRSLFSFVDRKTVEKTLVALQAQYGIALDLTCPISSLSVGMQQKAEILKLLYTGADILIFDEPTAVLLPDECKTLFDTMRSLTAQGKGILFISHKLEEVLDISDDITVLTRGCVTGEIATADADRETIIRMMVGETITLPTLCSKPTLSSEQMPVLSGRALHARDDRGIATLNGVSVDVHAGEIVGVAVVEGNGQSELAEVLAGVRGITDGQVLVSGKVISTAAAGDFIKNKIAYVPADRHTVGTVPDFPLYENWILRKDNIPKTKLGLFNYKEIRRQSAEAMEKYDVRAASGVYQRSADLSGGNLQKFILARELEKKPDALICSYPTRGLDIKASCFVREIILTARADGLGVLLLSGDFEELFALCDRIVVLYRGQIVGETTPQKSTVQQVAKMMMGVTVNETV